MSDARSVAARAQGVIDEHGAGAMAHVERRMLELLADGDEAGALTWTAIAEQIEVMRRHVGERHVLDLASRETIFRPRCVPQG